MRQVLGPADDVVFSVLLHQVPYEPDVLFTGHRGHGRTGRFERERRRKKRCSFPIHPEMSHDNPSVRNGSGAEWQLNRDHGWKTDIIISALTFLRKFIEAI